MLSIVRHLACCASTSLALPAARRNGVPALMAMSSRSWIVKDDTPFITSMTPLRERVMRLAASDPRDRAEAVPGASQPAQLGLEALGRATDEAQTAAASAMDRTPARPGRDGKTSQ